MSHRILDEALTTALDQHPKFAEATIERTCDDCAGEGVINYQEGIWHPDRGQYVVEVRPSMCYFCEGSGKIKVTPSGAELLDRACKSVGLDRG